jgi:hypothetical protein
MTIARDGTGGRRMVAAARLATDWLGLAAAPVFAAMALIAWAQGHGMPDMLCSSAHEASPLTGMVPMYVLMSAFHSRPWLNLLAGR